MDLSRFRFCPIASRFIDDVDGAQAYYAHKLVEPSDHLISVGSLDILVRFNPEEIHLFTETKPLDAQRRPRPLVRRPGASREARYFSIDRARRLDLILPTIRTPIQTLRATMPGATLLIGPPDSSALRIGVVVGPDDGARVYFVRTAFDMTPKQFQAKLRAHRPAPWPK